MEKKLILLTTAITRGNLHKQSIGLLYDKLYNYFSEYELIHIINIDCPLKLREKFNVNETKILLESIIPKNVKKIFSIKDDKTPSFAKAYISGIETMHKYNLFSEKTKDRNLL